MKNPMLTIQYLEDSPEMAHLDEKAIVNKLSAAAERLPFTHLLIGWNVPLPILETCRMEAERLGMRFLRWQPLLTDDKALHPNPEWRAVGLMGNKLVGYRSLPEFTFLCPNHPAVQEAVAKHLANLIHLGLYQGLFLDRVRFPSPSADPINELGCFCDHCQRKAAEVGLDLAQVKVDLVCSTRDEKSRAVLVKSLLTGKMDPEQTGQNLNIGQFVAFRKKSLVDFLAMVSHMLREAQLEIGLDCYSPSLTHMVGQDLTSMGALVDWIKLMTYAHTFAPAGIPFELSGLVHHLTSKGVINERQVLGMIGKTIHLPLPTSLRALKNDGLSTMALEKEVRFGVETCSTPVLAGMELVELEGVTNLNPDQIRSDLIGLIESRSAGLALSWDLLHIPLERLDLVRQVYLDNELSKG
jgi:hypothetical protein